MPDQRDLCEFEDRFIPEPNSGCWLWIAGVNNGGYGNAYKAVPGRTRKRLINSHRRAWELYRGEIPEGMWVLHRCDVSQCVNPDHLYLGTCSDNARDRVRRGRWVNQFYGVTHCANGHPFDVITPSRRGCRTCRNTYARRWRRTPIGRISASATSLNRRNPNA